MEITMVNCTVCRHEVDFNGGICPICGAALTPTEAEIAAAREALAVAIYKKNQPKAIAMRELLAFSGDTESEREYARFLETTDSARRNLDLAMRFYFSAARKNDPLSAYRYSRLVARTSEAGAIFWLKFSGVLGCVNAYPELYEHFDEAGRYEISAYYCQKAAEADDVPSIVSMAKRYADGLGVEQSEPCAKHYIDKFKIPPLSAIKLAHRLRAVTPEIPDTVEFPNLPDYLRSLIVEAQAYGYDTAHHKLTSLLADTGDVKAQLALGILTAEGVGTRADADAALASLMTAVMNGSADAAMYLADEYREREGKFGYSIEKALYYYELAAKAGAADAYVRVADIYFSGAHDPDGIPDTRLAIAILEEGARVGGESAAQRLEGLVKHRNECYEKGIKILASTEPVSVAESKQAFKYLTLAAVYGHAKAPRALAKCYAYGFGCDRSPKDAYLLYEEAYQLGDTEAEFSLGLCYAKGFGTQFSYKNAVKFLKLAASRGNADADALAKELARRRREKAVRALYATVCELIYMKKFTEAHRILVQTLPLGYPKAIYTLGLMYEFGAGCECSRKIANEYYEKARIGSAAYGSFVDDGAKFKSKFLKIIKRV